MLRSVDRRRIPYNNDINWKTNELVRKGGKPVEVPLRPSVLDRDVLALHLAEMVQPLQEGRALPSIRRRGRGAEQERANPGHLPRLLCVGCTWCHRDAEGKGDNETDGMEPPGSPLTSVSIMPESAIVTANRVVHDDLFTA